jgi:pimeloyl-ACP methyl ester carboxylesterase
MDMVNAFSLSTTAAKPSYPGPGMWLHGGNRQLMRQVQASRPEANVFWHDFQLCNAYNNGLQAAALVQCPAHFVLGAADQMTSPKTTREIAAALKATVHTLPGGHGLMQEQPDAVLAALRLALA